jgi:hypothetical protein
MIDSLRDQFNNGYTEDKYKQIYHGIHNQTDHWVPFRIAESPVFLDENLWQQLVGATNELIDQISKPEILQHGEGVFAYSNTRVPNENDRPHFIQFDFGIHQKADGTFHPYLIELQGFPSLYYFQVMLAKAYKDISSESSDLKHFADGITEEKYHELLDKIILNGHEPASVVLLEVDPPSQNTYIDFACTALKTGIKVICLSDVKRRGRDLSYIDNNGNSQPIKRIYNRIIFDELDQKKEFIKEYDMLQDVDVEWAGHPNWYFKLSKFSMPRLDSQYVPKTYFLNEIDYGALNLTQFVLKPLFSFSGSGVEIDINKKMLDDIKAKDQYIIQEKVEYTPLVKDPNGDLSKFEVRMMTLWPDDADKPILVNNLIRLSKGKMVGVKYNKDKIWVGGSIGFRK